MIDVDGCVDVDGVVALYNVVCGVVDGTPRVCVYQY